MKKVVQRRGIFSVENQVPENDDEAVDLLTPKYTRPEDRVKAFLDEVDATCKAWVPGPEDHGSDEMLREIRHSAHFLRVELKAGRPDESGRVRVPNPWRIADYAMILSKWWRDFEANEALFRPLEYAETTSEQRAQARVNAELANRKKQETADNKALEIFSEWQRKVRAVLVNKERQPLNAAARVKRYTTTQSKKLTDREKRRIRELLKAGRIPPLE